MSGYLIFEAFENGISIREDDLPKMVNYIYGNLNGSSYNPNYKYFYNIRTLTRFLLSVDGKSTWDGS